MSNEGDGEKNVKKAYAHRPLSAEEMRGIRHQASIAALAAIVGKPVDEHQLAMNALQLDDVGAQAVAYADRLIEALDESEPFDVEDFEKNLDEWLIKQGETIGKETPT